MECNCVNTVRSFFFYFCILASICFLAQWFCCNINAALLYSCSSDYYVGRAVCISCSLTAFSVFFVFFLVFFLDV